MPEESLILASGSPYRRELLGRLQIGFEVDPADIDETARDDESAVGLALRLARQKAVHVAQRHPGRWVLGSDQVAALGPRRLGKPGTRTRAAEQLRACAGRTVRFCTAMALVRDAEHHDFVDVTRVRFRALTDADIEDYLDREDALDCAGSFKSEGLGLSLVEHMQTDDPTALIGLPLIALSATLRTLGLLPGAKGS